MNTIQVRAQHVTSDIVNQDVANVLTQDLDLTSYEINPSTAVTIASWWQSSGRVGSVLAAFASGSAVDRDALLDDIHRTRVTNIINEGDALQLDCLATFVINYEQGLGR